MEAVGLIILLVILLKTIESGGNWFDFLQSEARYDVWRTNMEFTAIFWLLGLVVAGGAAWILIQAVKSETEVRPAYQAKSPPAALHSHRHPIKSHKIGKQHLHQVKE